MTRTLDRIPQFDERSRAFAIGSVAPMTLRGRSWVCKPRLDQGREGACVGFGFAHELAATPVVVPNVDNAFAYGFYNEARQLTPQWSDGTSMLAGAKTAKSRGYIDGYYWGFGIDEVLAGIANGGPVLFGTWWTSGMDEPDENGEVDPTGEDLGGHCFMGRGLLLKPKWCKEPVVRFRNSWSETWGINGDFFMRASRLEALLKRQGEAVLLTGRKR
jgi:hypothetical protein